MSVKETDGNAYLLMKSGADAEREQCALLVEKWAALYPAALHTALMDIAASIRVRGQRVQALKGGSGAKSALSFPLDTPPDAA